MARPLTGAMDNVLAWRLGAACRKAADDPKCGDFIDRGLILLRMLNEAGFDVVPKETHRD